MTQNRRALWFAVAMAAALLAAPNFLRAYTVNGPSDAPTMWWRDRVLVNVAAYDLRLWGSGPALTTLSSPARGDMVLFELPGSPDLALKRVVGLPGDRIELRRHSLIVNDQETRRLDLELNGFLDVPPENNLGEVVQMEWLGQIAYTITYTPGVSEGASHGPVLVPPGQYFLLGDNRDFSRDSRHFGPVPRAAVRGKVLLRFWR